MNIILLGAPGAGKGTVATRLAKEHSMVAISTGDIFRHAIKEETPLGAQVKAIVERGDLVPDELTIALVKERLSQKDLSGGFILDGFPRTVAQAEALYQWKESPRIDRVVNFDIPEEDLINRLSGRWVCRKCGATYHKTFLPTKVEGVCDNCGSHDLFQRPDDMRESVEKRLQVYSEQTYPLIDFYTQKGILSHLDAQGTPEEVFKSMEKLLSLA